MAPPPPITPTLEPIPDVYEGYDDIQHISSLAQSTHLSSYRHDDDDDDYMDSYQDINQSRDDQDDEEEEEEEEEEDDEDDDDDDDDQNANDYDSFPADLPSHFRLGLSSNPRSQPMTPLRLRPRSTSSISAPALSRTNFSPVMYSPIPSLMLPTSVGPLRSPNRMRSPFRLSVPDHDSLSPEISQILDSRELQIFPQPQPRLRSFSSSSSTSSSSSNFGRVLSGKRSRSPIQLRSLRASSMPASPNLLGGRFNESFPPDLSYSRSSAGSGSGSGSGSFSTLFASSSVPSTPTSLRSRSPSIYSLETIVDTPEAELSALQAFEKDKRESRSRTATWDSQPSTPASSQGGGKDRPKRWSVCGAEKRCDLNLETIWED